MQYSSGAGGPSRADVAAAQANAKAVADRLLVARAEAEGAQKQLGVVRAGIDNLCDRLTRSQASAILWLR